MIVISGCVTNDKSLRAKAAEFVEEPQEDEELSRDKSLVMGADTPEEVISELSKALEENRKSDATMMFLPDTRPKYEEMFDSMGDIIRSEFVDFLNNLSEGESELEWKIYTGTWKSGNISIQQNFLIYQDPNGRWWAHDIMQ